MQTGDQIKSQTESLSAMAIAFADNPKDFQSPNHIFNFDALRSQLSIRLLFCFAQPVQFAVFLRQNHIRHLRLQAPISQIGAQATVFTETDAAQLKQFVVVRLAFAEKCCRDLFRLFINDKLFFNRPLAKIRI